MMEAASWSISGIFNTSLPKFSLCNDTYLLGGYNILMPGKSFSRTYRDLPPHDIIYYSMNFWLIDSWDYGDSFTFLFDSKSVTPWNHLSFSANFTNIDYCGSHNWNDQRDVRIY